MVIKKDPRKVLDMLGKPVEVDDDEFLDTLDPNVSGLVDFSNDSLLREPSSLSSRSST